MKRNAYFFFALRLRRRGEFRLFLLLRRLFFRGGNGALLRPSDVVENEQQNGRRDGSERDKNARHVRKAQDEKNGDQKKNPNHA